MSGFLLSLGYKVHPGLFPPSTLSLYFSQIPAGWGGVRRHSSILRGGDDEDTVGSGQEVPGSTTPRKSSRATKLSSSEELLSGRCESHREKQDSRRTGGLERLRESATLRSRGSASAGPGSPGCQATCASYSFQLAVLDQFERRTEAALAHPRPRFLSFFFF